MLKLCSASSFLALTLSVVTLSGCASKPTAELVTEDVLTLPTKYSAAPTQAPTVPHSADKTSDETSTALVLTPADQETSNNGLQQFSELKQTEWKSLDATSSEIETAKESVLAQIKPKARKIAVSAPTETSRSPFTPISTQETSKISSAIGEAPVTEAQPTADTQTVAALVTARTPTQPLQNPLAADTSDAMLPAQAVSTSPVTASVAPKNPFSEPLSTPGVPADTVTATAKPEKLFQAASAASTDLSQISCLSGCQPVPLLTVSPVFVENQSALPEKAFSTQITFPAGAALDEILTKASQVLPDASIPKHFLSRRSTRPFSGTILTCLDFLSDEFGLAVKVADHEIIFYDPSVYTFSIKNLDSVTSLQLLKTTAQQLNFNTPPTSNALKLRIDTKLARKFSQLLREDLGKQFPYFLKVQDNRLTRKFAAKTDVITVSINAKPEKLSWMNGSFHAASYPLQKQTISISDTQKISSRVSQIGDFF